MKKLILAPLVVIFILAGYKLSYSAGLRFGMARAARERTKDLDKKVEEKQDSGCQSLCTSTVTISKQGAQSYPSYSVKQNYVVLNNDDWEKLWSSISSTPLPEVCFAKCMVLAVFLGSQGSGGHLIEISSLNETASTLDVFVTETSPGKGCFSTQAQTAPWHIIKIRRIDKPVIFMTTRLSSNCQ